MKTAIIGSGNVASHFAKALIKAGNPVMQIWSFHHANAIDLALEIGADSISDINQISNQIELIIIAVKDEFIEHVVKQIKHHQAIVVHTSGTTSLEVFNENFDSFGVIYPLQTLSKQVEIDFAKVPLCIEASSKQTLDKIKRLSDKLSEAVHEINSVQRMMIHISAVFACNFTNHFYTIAEKILQENNLSFDLIKPLITETANKINYVSPASVQTGPAVRDDISVINKHIGALQNHTEWQKIYEVISNSIVKMYHPNLDELK